MGQQGEPEDSADVIGFAFEAASPPAAPPCALRAWTRRPSSPTAPARWRWPTRPGAWSSTERKALGEALTPWRERFLDVPVVEHVEMGSAGQVAAVGVRERPAPVVVGRRAAAPAVGARIGSVAHGVLHHRGVPGGGGPAHLSLGRAAQSAVGWRVSRPWAGC